MDLAESRASKLRSPRIPLRYIRATRLTKSSTSARPNGHPNSSLVTGSYKTGIRTAYRSCHCSCSAISTVSTPSGTQALTITSACSQRWQPEVPNSIKRISMMQMRRQPALGDFFGDAFASGVILQLVFIYLADVKILRLGMGKIPAAYRRGRVHCITLGQLYGGMFGHIEQFKQLALLGMIGTRRVTRRRPYALIGFVD